MAWTEERVEVLKKLWTDGLSASQIAMELGGVTRNAVIGKVHRLGLSGRGKTSSTVSRTRQPRTPSNTSRQRQGNTTIGNTALKMAPGLAPAPAPRPAQYEELVIPITERANIMQLNEQTCRWPIGDPTSKDFHFCGRKISEGSTYCSYHCRIAYQSTPERRREKKTAAG